MAKMDKSSGLQLLMEFWERYAPIEKFHTSWAQQYISEISTRRGDIIYDCIQPEHNFYFVCQGAIVLVCNDERTGKRKIESLAIPEETLKTTQHLYSNTPRNDRIECIRSGLILKIPYKALKFHEFDEHAINILIKVFSNRKTRQLQNHMHITMIKFPRDRYVKFLKLFTEHQYYMTQQEQADFILVSRRSIQKYQRSILKLNGI